jgi:hypothetical protein
MTIIYTSGGDDYKGEHSTQNLSYWRWYGKQKNQKYMYKGYRYFDNKKDIVIVYDNDLWNIAEYQKRKANGFLGIKRYDLK